MSEPSARSAMRPWKANEIEAVETLRLSILEVVLRRMDQVSRERAEAQEKQSLLVAELDHRVKNTIANIQSLMRHTKRSQTALDGYVESLEKRIKAMAYTHNLLSQSRWQGAGMRTLLEDEMRAHRDAGNAITLAGDIVKLKPQAALSLSIVFHELTTNAAKYGALSSGSGRLKVDWVITDDEFRIEWRESHGPAVEPPTHRGFGRTLIEQLVGFELEGDVSLRFEPGGVECDFIVPMAHVYRTASAKVGKTGEPTANKAAAGRRMKILLVEDSMITAMDLAKTLEDSGFEVLGPTGRISAALGIIEREAVDTAILDINLGREDSFPVADALMKKEMPFVFLTGYDAASVLPDRFASLTCLSKPFSDDALIKVMNRITSGQ